MVKQTHMLSRRLDKKHARHKTMRRIYDSLYDRLLHRRALAQAFAKVRRAKGAKTPENDEQTATDFAENLTLRRTKKMNSIVLFTNCGPRRIVRNRCDG